MTLAVAYISPFVPPEWIAAHGLRPTRLVPDSPPELAPPAGLCPFAAAFARSASVADAVVITTTCDQMRRIAEQITTDPSRLFLMNVPATWQIPAPLQLYTDELRRLARFLVRLGGVSPTPQHLAAVMRHHDADRRIVRSSASPHNAVRLALVGPHLRQQDLWLFDCITQAGGCVALDATDTGQRSLPAPFNDHMLSIDPLAELARAYFLTIPDAFRRPDTLLHQYLRQQLVTCRIQGIILVRYLWCDQWHAQLPRLKENLKVPVVEIDLGGQDHDLARTRNRIESLVGILQ